MTMSTTIDYTKLAATLDYAAVEKKLEQLTQRDPPRKRKTVADVLEPLRDRLLDLHSKGWSASQLADELKTAGVTVSAARLRECLSGWMADGDGAAKSRTRRRPKRVAATAQPTITATHAGRSADSQPGLRLSAR
jgi:hypothetical protein